MYVVAPPAGGEKLNCCAETPAQDPVYACVALPPAKVMALGSCTPFPLVYIVKLVTDTGDEKVNVNV